MFKQNFAECKFICLSDVASVVDKENPVLFNPSADDETNKRVIRREIEKHFGTLIDESVLDELMKCDRTDFTDFIKKLKSIAIIG